MDSDIQSNSLPDRLCRRLLQIIALSAIILICSCGKKPSKVYFHGEAAFSAEPANKTISIYLPEIHNDGKGDSGELVAVLVAKSQEKKETRVLVAPLPKVGSMRYRVPITVTAKIDKFPKFEEAHDLSIRLSEGPNSKTGPNFKDARHLGSYVFREREWLHWWERIHLWRWCLGIGAIILCYFTLPGRASKFREILLSIKRMFSFAKPAQSHTGVFEDVDYRSRAIEAIKIGNIPLAEALLDEKSKYLSAGNVQKAAACYVREIDREGKLIDSRQTSLDLLPLILEHGMNREQIKIIMASACGRAVVFRDYGAGNLLHEAIRNCKTEAAYTIIVHTRQTEDLLIPDSKGTTPFHLAAQSGNPELVQLLLIYDKHGVSIEATDANNNSSFHYAACSPATLKYLCAISNNNPDLIFQPNNSGETPLATNARALERGEDHTECWRFLLGLARVEDISRGKAENLLHIVAAVGTRRLMGDLLLKINDHSVLNQRDSRGQTAADIAINIGRHHLAAMIAERVLLFERKVKAAQIIVPPHKRENVTFDLESYDPLSLTLKLIAAVQNGDFNHFKKFFAEDPELATSLRDPDFGCPLSIIAATSDQAEILEFLLDNGVPIEIKNTRSETALHYSANYNSVRCLHLLLSRQANINAQEIRGITPLAYAAMCGNIEALQILLNSGADIEKPTNEDETPLMWAASRGHNDCIEVLLRHGADVNSGSKHAVPLALAADRGHADSVGLLIMAGADPNRHEEFGWTPLNWAICSGHTQACKRLLNHHADPNQIDNSETSAIFHAIEKDDIEMVRMLTAVGANVNSKIKAATPLIQACLGGSPEVVAHLLEKGADPNFKDADGDTPLMCAIIRENSTIVNLLASASAIDINLRNSRQETPLIAAVNRSDAKSVEALLRNNCDRASTYDDGKAALHRAAALDCDEIVELLIEYQANVNALCDKGRSPLSYAAQYDQVTTAHNLVIAGADINSANSDGWTPLMYAAFNNSFSTSCILLRLREINMNAQNNVGETALMMAARYGSLMCAQKLVESGAVLHPVDEDGRNALELANFYVEPQTSSFLYEVYKHQIASKFQAPILPDLSLSAKTHLTNMSSGIAFVEILSALYIAAYSDTTWTSHNPEKRLEDALRAAKPLSTNIPFYEERFHRIVMSLSEQFGIGLVEDLPIFRSAILELEVSVLNSFVSDSAVRAVIVNCVSKHRNCMLHNSSDNSRATFMVELLQGLRQIEAPSSDLTRGKFSELVRSIQARIENSAGRKITLEQSRYSFPLSNIQASGEFILHAASAGSLKFAGGEGESAFVYAAKKNRPDLLAAMAIGRWIKLGTYDNAVCQDEVDEAMFWGIFYGSLATVKLCLQLGAKIDSKPVFYHITCGELARHLEHQQILELFAEKSGVSYEIYTDLELPNILLRYNKIARSIAHKCYPDNGILQEGYTEVLQHRFICGKYIKYQLRKVLNDIDSIRVDSIDGSHDLYVKNADIPPLPDQAIQQIKQNGLVVMPPSVKSDLVSPEEIQQIYQELIVGNLLGQAPSLSLENGEVHGKNTKVELPEAFKNTLTGEILIFTDEIQKRIWQRCMYVSPEMQRALGENHDPLLYLEKGADGISYLGAGVATFTKPQYFEKIRENLFAAGAVETPAMQALNVAYLDERARYLKANNYVDQEGGGGRWKNCNFRMVYDENRIFCSQNYCLYQDVIYRTSCGKTVEHNDDEHLPTARFLTSQVASITEYARHFELLKVVYSLQPIAQLAVAHEVIPNFSSMILPRFVTTPDHIPDVYTTNAYSNTLHLASGQEALWSMLEDREDSYLRLGQGTAYTTGVYKDNIERSPSFFNTPSPRNDQPASQEGGFFGGMFAGGSSSDSSRPTASSGASQSSGANAGLFGGGGASSGSRHSGGSSSDSGGGGGRSDGSEKYPFTSIEKLVSRDRAAEIQSGGFGKSDFWGGVKIIKAGEEIATLKLSSGEYAVSRSDLEYMIRSGKVDSHIARDGKAPCSLFTAEKYSELNRIPNDASRPVRNEIEFFRAVKDVALRTSFAKADIDNRDKDLPGRESHLAQLLIPGGKSNYEGLFERSSVESVVLPRRGEEEH